MQVAVEFRATAADEVTVLEGILDKNVSIWVVEGRNSEDDFVSGKSIKERALNTGALMVCSETNPVKSGLYLMDLATTINNRLGRVQTYAFAISDRDSS
jgi:hypothetical protein